MSRTNDYKLHVHVLPEDKANMDLAIGFELATSHVYAALQVLSPAKGWTALLSVFEVDHIPRMRANPHRLMVLLIDFDKDQDRRSKVQKRIPSDLADRVFVLGAWDEPDPLKKEFGPDYELIGQRLAEDCRDGTSLTWSHPQFRHNSDELLRLNEKVRQILFP